MTSHPHGKHFFYVLFAAVAILCFLIFKPFFVILILGVALAVVFHPVFVWLKNKITGNLGWLAALLTTLLFIIILCVPMYLIGVQVIKEAQTIYSSVSGQGSVSNYLDSLSRSLHGVFPQIETVDIKGLISQMVSFFSVSLASIFSSTLHTLFSFLLIIMSMFYFLKDGERWRKYIVHLSPLPDKSDNRILNMLDHSVNAIMKGYLLIALIQGTLMGIGLWIFGVPNAILWGVLAGIASVIPSVGTTIVAVPAVLYLLVTGGAGPAIGFGIWALTLVGSVDNLLNPVVMGKRISLPPIVVLFGVLGGIAMFGAAGIIVGPLTVSLLYTLILIYREDFKAN